MAARKDYDPADMEALEAALRGRAAALERADAERSGRVTAGRAVRAAARRIVGRIAADTRGIALQTVIVMVVLIAIAGGVATVLLQTGSEGADKLEAARVGPDAEDFTSQPLREAAGHLRDKAKTPDCSHNLAQAPCVAAGLWWHSSMSLCVTR